MDAEAHNKLHKEAIDLHGQLLRCAELATAEGDLVVAAFYSRMCDAVAHALAETGNTKT
jgi:hypothetical protein